MRPIFKYFFVLLSLLMILGGVLNDGASGSFFALPFIVFIIYASTKMSLPKGFKLFMGAWIIMCLFFQFTLSSNYILYPQIGKTVKLPEITVYKYTKKECAGFADEWVYLREEVALAIAEACPHIKAQLQPQEAQIVAIYTTNPDFSTKGHYAFNTSQGMILIEEEALAGLLNDSSWAHHERNILLSLNYLMYYPIILAYPISWFKKLF